MSSVRKMGDRCSVLGLAVLLATAALGVAPTAAAQVPLSGLGAWEGPRTPAGHPDLQGNWTNVTLTPFEREEGQEPVLTRAEVEEIEGREGGRILEGSQPSDPDRPAPPADGNIGTYNEVYWDRGSRVAIVNNQARSSLLTTPPDGRKPPFTRRGQRRVDEYRESRSRFGEYDHPELRPLGERCIVSFGSSAGPPMIPNKAYNNNYTIIQTDDHVVIMSEMVHDVRIIRLGEPQRLPEAVRPWFGDSWGRWEGNTLVVETTNIHPDQTFLGVPPSEHLSVTERFTPVDDETLLYAFTIDDPATYTEPWGGDVPFKRLDDRLYEYACHEGNYSLYGVLSGARYQEPGDPDGSR